MNCHWTPNQVVLRIDREDLPLDADIVEYVFEECSKDALQGDTVARFIVLGISIMFKQCIKFMRE